jgi:transposase
MRLRKCHPDETYNMREIIAMTEKERKQCRIIEGVLQGVYTVKEASSILGVTSRHVKRLKKNYLLGGVKEFVHKNAGRKPVHALSEELKRKIIDLSQSSLYKGSNDRHLAELLQQYEEIKVSPSSIRKILRGAGIAPKRKRRTKQPHRLRERKPRYGMMIQLDASHHKWLEGRSEKFTLFGGIDDATSKITGGLFRKNEDLEGYLQLMLQMIETDGLPEMIYTDMHTIFRSPKENLVIEEQLEGKNPLSQFGKAMDDLEIIHVKAHSPQAKGRIERLWGTLQDRLPVELRIRGVCTMEEANAILPELIQKHNEQFAVEPMDINSAFKPYSSTFPLRNILCYRGEMRTVGSGQTITYKGKTYRMVCTDKVFQRKSRIEVRETLDGHRFVYSDGNCYELGEMTETKPILPEKQEREEVSHVKCTSPHHPWRQFRDISYFSNKKKSYTSS